jgi:hypothetical protein
MNRDDIIRMAREADLLVLAQIPDDSVFVADLERFAALVAAAEREACAAVCEEHWYIDGQHTAYEFARTIRARGQP